MSNWYFDGYPSGHLGTYFTLQAMQALARKDYRDPAVLAVIRKIINPTGGETLTEREAVKRLFQYSRDCIIYTPDPPDIELVQDFLRSTKSGKGDCDDKATWLATALLSIGLPARFGVQSFMGGAWAAGWDHVYVEYYDYSRWRWIALDPTADGHEGTPIAAPGWRNPVMSGGYEFFFQV